MAKKVFLFIILIRALGAIIITNSHYTGVYPTDLLANGGMLGDVLFFSVSGFCLTSANNNWGKWYLNRIIRVYIPSWIMTIIYMVLGFYLIKDWQDIFTFFIWPTHWHFVASIIILYIPIYFISKYIEMNSINYRYIASILFLFQLIIYFTIYDFSYYHIDTVREPMIEFIFFQSMLLGLYYRWKVKKTPYKNKQLRASMILICLVLLTVYFSSKLIFVKIVTMAPFQLINQIILWLLLYVIFDIFMRLEYKLHQIESTKFWTCIKFISERTLEIYLVQYVILDNCKMGPFPVNWLLLTGSIIITAIILRWLSQPIIKYLSQKILN